MSAKVAFSPSIASAGTKLTAPLIIGTINWRARLSMKKRSMCRFQKKVSSNSSSQSSKASADSSSLKTYKDEYSLEKTCFFEKKQFKWNEECSTVAASAAARILCADRVKLYVGEKKKSPALKQHCECCLNKLLFFGHQEEEDEEREEKLPKKLSNWFSFFCLSINHQFSFDWINRLFFFT